MTDDRKSIWSLPVSHCILRNSNYRNVIGQNNNEC